MGDYMTNYLLTRTGLNILHGKCEIFKRMIEAKDPERKELIESFEISKNECIEAMLFIEEVDREMRVLRQRASDLEIACAKLSQENAQLRLTAEKLIDRVEL